MSMKNSTISAPAVAALHRDTKATQHPDLVLIAAIVISVLLWKLYTELAHAYPLFQQPISGQSPIQTDKAIVTKWRYDEMAHKLIMENTELQCAQLEYHFSEGIGKALSKITKQHGGKQVIVNL